MTVPFPEHSWAIKTSVECLRRPVWCPTDDVFYGVAAPEHTEASFSLQWRYTSPRCASPVREELYSVVEERLNFDPQSFICSLPLRQHLRAPDFSSILEKSVVSAPRRLRYGGLPRAFGREQEIGNSRSGDHLLPPTMHGVTIKACIPTHDDQTCPVSLRGTSRTEGRRLAAPLWAFNLSTCEYPGRRCGGEEGREEVRKREGEERRTCVRTRVAGVAVQHLAWGWQGVERLGERTRECLVMTPVAPVETPFHSVGKKPHVHERHVHEHHVHERHVHERRSQLGPGWLHSYRVLECEADLCSVCSLGFLSKVRGVLLASEAETVLLRSQKTGFKPQDVSIKEPRWDIQRAGSGVGGVSGYHGDTGTRLVSETPLTAGASDAAADTAGRPGLESANGFWMRGRDPHVDHRQLSGLQFHSDPVTPVLITTRIHWTPHGVGTTVPGLLKTWNKPDRRKSWIRTRVDLERDPRVARMGGRPMTLLSGPTPQHGPTPQPRSTDRPRNPAARTDPAGRLLFMRKKRIPVAISFYLTLQESLKISVEEASLQLASVASRCGSEGLRSPLPAHVTTARLLVLSGLGLTAHSAVRLDALRSLNAPHSDEKTHPSNSTLNRTFKCNFKYSVKPGDPGGLQTGRIHVDYGEGAMKGFLQPCASDTMSRSRSRSRSPSSKPRERKYAKAQQARGPGPREVRGYHHRGFQRPFHFRGRGRGFFPRGRFQRGGGGGGGMGYNHNNFRHNWKNFRQCPPQRQQYQQPQWQQYHPRGRSTSPRKRPGVTPPSHVPRSDHSSSSPKSRRSPRSSSSHSSCSPKQSATSELANQNLTSNGKEEQPPSKEAGEEEEEEEGEEREEEVGEGVIKDGSDGGKWRGLTGWSCGLKKSTPPECSADDGHMTLTPADQSSPAHKNTTSGVNSGAPSWQGVGNKSPPQKSPRAVFGVFSKEDNLDGASSTVPAAFRKFLEEQSNGSGPGRGKGLEAGGQVAGGGKLAEEGAANGKTSCCVSNPPPRRRASDFRTDMSLNSFLTASPFLCGGDNDKDDEERENKLQKGEDSSKAKVKTSALAVFEERLSQWESSGRRPLPDHPNLKQVYCIQRPQNTDAVGAKPLGFSPEKDSGRFQRMETHNTSSTPSPASQSTSLREMFRVGGAESPPSSSREDKCSVVMDFLRDRMTSSSDMLAGERQLSQDLVQSCRKEQEFRSIFQHVETSKLQRSPSELFTQHILTILHHVNAQYFPSSGGSLSERFATYQRHAAQQEERRRKSPEIHRRIDVSPSAFKKHSHLFEAMKSSEEGSYKDGGEKAMKGDLSDLRLDIERRKKISVGEQDCDQDTERGLRDPPVPSKEKSSEKSSKRHKKSKKSKKKRSRSSSSSSSSSSGESQQVVHPSTQSRSGDQDFSKTRLAQRDFPGPAEKGGPRGGFQFTVRGRGWNRGNHHGNGIHSNPFTVATQNEDWDPEFTPKSKKYYLHDDREGEKERRWVGGRGRGGGDFTHGRPRFIIRRAVTGGNHFQVNGKQKVNEVEGAGCEHVDNA
ncbi:Thyroid hormone receptor-associated protein 3 [Merluccius polli]|uniref:Thyroid hormone receptor-associated protein 3 n=1 Tax=Merluccius polli TaxID=89951 RepID=A0AA47MZE8_MERPO|nr:Thyroid hormone receptor-associated protein 3 [Merluccius polli]